MGWGVPDWSGDQDGTGQAWGDDLLARTYSVLSKSDALLLLVVVYVVTIGS